MGRTINNTGDNVEAIFMNFLIPICLRSLNGINSQGKGIMVLPEAIDSQAKAQCQVWVPSFKLLVKESQRLPNQ